MQKLFPENIRTETCPTCKKEWNLLTLDGICYSCFQDKSRAVEIEHDGIGYVGERAWRDFTIEKFITIPVTEDVLKTCRNFNPETDNLFIYGACGTGKTHLAVATWRRFFWGGRSSAVYTQPEMMRKFRLLEPVDEEKLLREFENYHVLVIDDLGVGKHTEFVNRIIYEILERRNKANRNGLIITSNLSPAAFAERVGDDRLPSRIAGMCKCVKISSTVDMRLKTPADGLKSQDI